MGQALQPVRGTHDLLAADFAAQLHVVSTAQKVASRYGYARIDTPIFEFSEVFHRTLGDTSDIVTKETYSFTDKGGESITLRPEFTAAIVRAFISNGLQQFTPWKCFYAGPAFRYERPQKGRLRQFHQIGVELLGAAEPEADAEMIALGMQILHALGLKDHLTLELNSLGDAETRAAYRTALTGYFAQHKAKLSADSVTRLEKNPLRILDSKDEGDRALLAGAPRLEEHFTDAAQHHFDRLREALGEFGIAYVLNPRLVRGLDYYSHTVFEITTDKLGAQGTVLAGGRYDGLVKLMGGNDTAGIGWAAGVERLASLIEATGKAAAAPRMDIAVIPMQETAEAAAWELAQALRHEGFAVDIGFKGNAKKRLERANRLGVKLALMLGEDEIRAGTVSVKNFATGAQETLPRETVAANLKGLLK
ncbi:MAG: histidine--tRNA ligase [Alphaproteobacteria bacterium]